MKNVRYDKVKTVRIHKQQFDSINKKADYIILQCVEDGRVINFKRLKKYQAPSVIVEKIIGLEWTLNEPSQDKRKFFIWRN